MKITWRFPEGFLEMYQSVSNDKEVSRGMVNAIPCSKTSSQLVHCLRPARLTTNPFDPIVAPQRPGFSGKAATFSTGFLPFLGAAS
jgi:hypothetical protein